MSGGWRSQRRPRPAREEDVVDLGAAFGVSVASDSDSSDAEFAPENEEPDPDDSHDDEEDGEEESMGAEDISMETEAQPPPGNSDKTQADSGEEEKEEEREKDEIEEEEEEYNPLIVRRSKRAIKPTKDIDLYLLGAQFGVDVEGSDADSSDLEFAPAAADSEASMSESCDDEQPGEREEEEEEGGRAEQGNTKDTPSGGSFSEVSYGQSAATNSKTLYVPLCSVCLETSKNEEDIVECDRCGISVHEGCYGIPEEDGVDDTRSDLSSFTTIPWFCDPCKANVSSTISLPCELCPTVGGLLKQTVNGRWVHVVCSLYTPGIEYVEPEQLSGVNLDQLAASKWGTKVCQLCEDDGYSKTGVCIACDAGMCKSFFHPTCAQKNGLLCEVDSDEEEEKELIDPYFAHCKAHSDKTLTKRKRRDYLSVITKQKRFKFDDSDDRIKHYLLLAGQSYLVFFKQMQDYYKPEKMPHNKEERLLKYIPNAFRRLTQKAEMLGYITEVVGNHGVEAKRRITPNLTCEFVNYFSERLARTRRLQEQQGSLASALDSLKEEEQGTQQQLQRLEKQLNTLRALGSEFHGQGANLYLNLSRICGRKFQLPETLLGASPEEEPPQQRKDVLVCEVCVKSHDCHLMALCDTCNQHYHIGCVVPPLTKVPKKTSRYGWECHLCTLDSEEELAPTIASFDEPASRSGRKLQPPKVLLYRESQLKTVYKKSKSKAKKRK